MNSMLNAFDFDPGPGDTTPFYTPAGSVTEEEEGRLQPKEGTPGDPYDELENRMMEEDDVENPILETLKDQMNMFLESLPKHIQEVVERFGKRFDDADENARGRVVDAYRRELNIELDVQRAVWRRMTPEMRFLWVTSRFIENYESATEPPPRRGNGIKFGGGIAPDPDIRYERLGKYLVHMPSLRKHILNVKYPSLVSVPRIPQKVISPELAEMLQDLLATGQLNPKLYAALSKQDKDYFADIAHLCQVGSKLGVSKKEDNEDMQRFAVLRGQILAGNDAPQVVKELKYLTLKLLNEGKFSKKSAHDLLTEILAIG